MYPYPSMLFITAFTCCVLILGSFGAGGLLNLAGEDGSSLIQIGFTLLWIVLAAAVIVGAMFLVAELRYRRELTAKDWASKQPENQWGHFVEVSPEGIVCDLRINRLGMRKIIKPTGASINDLNKTGYITYEYSDGYIAGYPYTGGTITFWTGDPGIADGDFINPTRAFRSSFKVSIAPIFYADTVGSDQFRQIIDERFAGRKNFTWEQLDAFVVARAEEKAYSELELVE
jgi:hypothetical protein